MVIKDIYEPTNEMLIYPVITVFVCNTLLFLCCQSPWGNRDNSWIDVMWSLSFVFQNLVVLTLRQIESYKNDDAQITKRMILSTSLVFVWALRLSFYIFKRHKGEDWRYKMLRDKWESYGDIVYYTLSYSIIFFGQSIASLINNSSALFIILYSKHDPLNDEIQMTDMLGFLIWAIGFYIEVASDRQLSNHLAKPAPGSGKFLKAGLWRYSRHPNYFGEAVMWWGIFIIACGIHNGWKTIYSCVFITFMLRFVTGVPFPEIKYRKNKEWLHYCKETNIFCLWFA